MIKYIQYYGQRRTGSSWLGRVLKQTCNVSVGEKFGLKHDITCDKSKGSTDTTLFLFINRDIYLWLYALHKNPWGLEERRNVSLKEFIRLPWYNFTDVGIKKWYPHCDLKPNTKIMDYSGGLLIPGEFETPIHMRNAKVSAWADIKSSVQYAEYIIYLDMIKDVSGYVGGILDKYNVPRNNVSFAEGLLSAKKLDFFLSFEYLNAYDEEDFAFIRKACNVDIEKEIGFVI